ncbi:unnamed protein product, partial [Sphacelaria rigidula]
PLDDVHRIYLGAYDQDLDPTTPNYPLNHSLPTVVLSTLPDTGYLYELSGTQIVSTPFTLELIDGFYPVRYRPLPNEASPDGWTPYTSFQYFAEDSANASRSRLATVSIVVTAKNDPPVAFNDSDFVYVGTRENILHFFGSDMDDDDYVTGARVAIFPARGQLFQVCAG